MLFCPHVADTDVYDVPYKPVWVEFVEQCSHSKETEIEILRQSFAGPTLRALADGQDTAARKERACEKLEVCWSLNVRWESLGSFPKSQLLDCLRWNERARFHYIE